MVSWGQPGGWVGFSLGSAKFKDRPLANQNSLLKDLLCPDKGASLQSESIFLCKLVFVNNPGSQPSITALLVLSGLNTLREVNPTNWLGS